MAEYDGEVVISARVDSDNIDGDLSKVSYKVTASLGRQRQVLANLQQQYDDFVSGLLKTPEQLGIEKSIRKAEQDLEMNMKKLSDLKLDLGSGRQNYDNLIPAAQENVKKLEAEIEKFTQRVEDSQKQVSTLAKRLQEVKLNPEATTSVVKLKENMDKLSQKSADVVSKISKPDTKNLKSASSSISKSFSVMSKGISGAFNLIGAPIRMGINLMQSFGRQIWSIAKTAFILHGLRSGFRGISDTLSAVLSSNEEFSTSLNQIKSNLLTAFYPIYQYILPALNNLMKALATGSAYLAQFVSMLMGKDIKQSQEGAKALLEQSRAIKDGTKSRQDATKSVKDQKAAFDKLGKSIKESKKELASFDKLIVLNQDKEKEPKVKTPKDNGFEFSPTLAYDDTYDKILSWWGNIGKIVNNTKEKIIELGIEFSKGFDFAFVDRNFSEIYDKTTKIGGHLKEIFDDPEIQTGFNTALMSWSKALGAVAGATASIGVTIGRAIVGGFEKFLDENKIRIKEDLEKVFNISIDYSNLVTSLSKAIANIFSVFGDEHAQKIVSDFMTTIYTIFYEGFILISEMVVDTAKVFFRPFIEHQDDIKEALGGLLEWASILTGDIKDIFKNLMDNLRNSYENVFKPILGWLGELWNKVIGDMIVYVKDQIGNALNFVKGIRNVFSGIWDFITGDAQKASDSLNRIFNGLEQIFKSIMNHIIDSVNLGLGFLKSGINFGIDTINKIPGVNIQRIPDNSWKIPPLAQGAVLEGGNPMLAYLNDQPRGQVNIETPLNTMLEAFKSALDQRQGMANNVVIQADGDINSIVSLLNFKIQERNNIVGNNYIKDGVFA